MKSPRTINSVNVSVAFELTISEDEVLRFEKKVFVSVELLSLLLKQEFIFLKSVESSNIMNLVQRIDQPWIDVDFVNAKATASVIISGKVSGSKPRDLHNALNYLKSNGFKESFSNQK